MKIYWLQECINGVTIKTAQIRMRAINDFEELLQKHNATHILKFYLHISPGEQHQRLSERMTRPG
jgi:polyphosphate kinase 2 (PPK2 family)